MSGAAVALGALLMLILAPIAAMLIQMAVSRSREYQADETGAHFTGNPYALASALSKLDAYSRRVPMMGTPSTAHLFIIQPLLGMNFGNLFSTHPPIAKRIERLTGRPAEFHAVKLSARQLSAVSHDPDFQPVLVPGGLKLRADSFDT